MLAAGGAVPPNPSELLGSQAAKNLLTELRAKYDYVIVDSSPLLAVTDSAILAAGADGALMMVRFGYAKTGSTRACYWESQRRRRRCARRGIHVDAYTRRLFL